MSVFKVLSSLAMAYDKKDAMARTQHFLAHPLPQRTRRVWMAHPTL